MILPVILAGGSGTRLWPLSRCRVPKQLLAVAGDESLLQQTVRRLGGLQEATSPLIICHETHRFLVAEQMRQVDVVPSAIFLEPEGRNTAPAVATAAIHGMREGGDPLLWVLPADHHVGDAAALIRALQAGIVPALEGRLVTFGVMPQAPETGYGYIKKGDHLADNVHEIHRFEEKPHLDTARQYLASGDYFWNSGMFLFRASVVLDDLTRHEPGLVDACREAVEQGVEDLDFFRLHAPAFGRAPSISLDHAVMERTDRGVVVPLDCGWDDLGSWESLWQTGTRDEQQNVVKGDVIAVGTDNAYLHSCKRLLAVVGVSNLVVVETADAVLVAARDRVQHVKDVVETLRTHHRDEAINHRKVFRPWGSYETLEAASRFQVKRIIVKPGARLSLQKHLHRAEHWVVLRGMARVTRGDETFLLREDESTYIPVGMEHRLENPGGTPLELLEVQSGSYLGEDDIVRLDDVYGR